MASLQRQPQGSTTDAHDRHKQNSTPGSSAHDTKTQTKPQKRKLPSGSAAASTPAGGSASGKKPSTSGSRSSTDSSSTKPVALPLPPPAVQPRASVHARRAHALTEQAARRKQRTDANAREHSRFQDASSAVAIDFDALDSLPWMPSSTRAAPRRDYSAGVVGAAGAGAGGGGGVSASSTDAQLQMDFRPRPPKLGIGAKAKAEGEQQDDDTGLRKARRSLGGATWSG
jgi:hypothetical protein